MSEVVVGGQGVTLFGAPGSAGIAFVLRFVLAGELGTQHQTVEGVDVLGQTVGSAGTEDFGPLAQAITALLGGTSV